MQTFDLEALIRACLIGLSVAIIGRYIIHLVTRGRPPERESKRLLTMAALATFILVAMGAYYGWPSLSTVPVLDNLSQADAEALLLKHKLVPQPRPQMSPEISAGLVVPHSQAPAAGITVHPGTVVSFGVSVSQQTSGHNGTSGGELSISMFNPRSGEALHCIMGGDGICRCKVSGGSSGIDASRSHLLLWLQPVKPPSDQFGWYLERSGNGVSRIEPDGSWAGIVQVGNAQYPPHEGDIVNVAVSDVDEATYRDLMGRGGVVIEPQPIGSKADIASNVVITLK